MSKAKRKTRKQKIIADLHRQLYSFKSQNVVNLQEEKKVVETPSKPKPISESVLTKTPQTITTAVYPFLIQDISKTGILTGVILIIQLVIFFLLKNHILKLPGIAY